MSWTTFGLQMGGLVACLIVGGCVQRFFANKFGIGKSRQNAGNNSIKVSVNEDSIKSIATIIEKQDIHLNNKKIKLDNSFCANTALAVAERYMKRGCKKIDTVLEKFRENKELKIESEQDLEEVALPIIVNKLDKNIDDLEKFVKIMQTKGLNKLTNSKGLKITKKNFGGYCSIIKKYKLNGHMTDFAELLEVGGLPINDENFENYCLTIKKNELAKSTGALAKLSKLIGMKKAIKDGKSDFSKYCESLSVFGGKNESLGTLAEIVEVAGLDNISDFNNLCDALKQNKKVSKESLERLKSAFQKAPKRKTLFKKDKYKYLMDLVRK